ncbi:hypothetical protein PM004_08715 [Clostridium paraputrificum]|uniref:hypothetical protein n=1 Tax=Clostridium TaxID=1485 RepID=UPI00232E2D97|nr:MULTISPECIES: hypothetical protein [Clostridium]MDB2089418.1 hypothetical protein [Clostridium paraputrificum]MDB2096354.1 hypothetical protein [Clostridium paraputrificum]MDU1179975.1 hypothetical protein [Clostridium sp.]MDU1226919.1 hypothetical protein [Clostridium sp.]MDU7653104.1 hypothetical protein [Clostridium sp.]
MLFYDFEVFSQDWLVVIKDTDTRSTNKILNDPDALREIYEKNKNNIWVGYNSRSYDQYILKGILLGMDPKKINDHIIVKNLGGWQYSRAFNHIQFYNFDIMTDKFKGLKQLEGFMGNDIRETTVNFNIDRKLTPKEIEETFFYCNHDVEQTMKVFINRKEEFDSQMNLIKTFKLPLKYINKTKAQLSAIILEADKREHDDEFEITIVDTLKVEKYKSIVNWYRNPVNLDYKKKLEIEVADVIHLFGWGGLHGARVKYQDEGIFINSDVTSFYPSLMIEYGFLSRNVRHAEKFKEIYDIRVELKKEGKKKEQAPYKIVLNSTYGASKDKYNNLFDPLQANNVCINGQLLLLDLIEHVTDKIPGAKLIQSNTDGVMFKLPNEETIDIYKDVCKEWETRTRMGLEHDLIKKVIQKDVNNYIIVMDNGKIKSKGAYVKSLNSLDYDLPIVNKALMEYFISGIPVEETINNCNDLIEFQKVVKVSSKYKFSLYGDQVLNENILRVFASRSRRDPGVYKLKKYKDTKDKIGGTPERCFIENGDIKGIKVPRKLDKQWYIDTAKKRIKDFVGEV